MINTIKKGFKWQHVIKLVGGLVIILSLVACTANTEDDASDLLSDGTDTLSDYLGITVQIPSLSSESADLNSQSYKNQSVLKGLSGASVSITDLMGKVLKTVDGVTDENGKISIDKKVFADLGVSQEQIKFVAQKAESTIKYSLSSLGSTADTLEINPDSTSMEALVESTVAKLAGDLLSKAKTYDQNSIEEIQNKILELKGKVDSMSDEEKTSAISKLDVPISFDATTFSEFDEIELYQQHKAYEGGIKGNADALPTAIKEDFIAAEMALEPFIEEALEESEYESGLEMPEIHTDFVNDSTYHISLPDGFNHPENTSYTAGVFAHSSLESYPKGAIFENDHIIAHKVNENSRVKAGADWKEGYEYGAELGKGLHVEKNAEIPTGSHLPANMTTDEGYVLDKDALYDYQTGFTFPKSIDPEPGYPMPSDQIVDYEDGFVWPNDVGVETDRVDNDGKLIQMIIPKEVAGFEPGTSADNVFIGYFADDFVFTDTHEENVIYTDEKPYTTEFIAKWDNTVQIEQNEKSRLADDVPIDRALSDHIGSDLEFTSSDMSRVTELNKRIIKAAAADYVIPDEHLDDIFELGDEFAGHLPAGKIDADFISQIETKGGAGSVKLGEELAEGGFISSDYNIQDAAYLEDFGEHIAKFLSPTKKLTAAELDVIATAGDLDIGDIAADYIDETWTTDSADHFNKLSKKTAGMVKDEAFNSTFIDTLETNGKTIEFTEDVAKEYADSGNKLRTKDLTYIPSSEAIDKDWGTYLGDDAHFSESQMDQITEFIPEFIEARPTGYVMKKDDLDKIHTFNDKFADVLPDDADLDEAFFNGIKSRGGTAKVGEDLAGKADIWKNDFKIKDATLLEDLGENTAGLMDETLKGSLTKDDIDAIVANGGDLDIGDMAAGFIPDDWETDNHEHFDNLGDHNLDFIKEGALNESFLKNIETRMNNEGKVVEFDSDDMKKMKEKGLGLPKDFIDNVKGGLKPEDMAHIDDAIEFDPDLFGSISEECLADATCKDTFQGKLSDHSKKVLGGTDGEIEVNYDFSKVNDDVDGDGMPDVYEDFYQFDKNNSDDTTDSDGDGLTNKQELELGTDPSKNDAESIDIKGKAFAGTDENSVEFGIAIDCEGSSLTLSYPNPNDTSTFLTFYYTYNSTSNIYEKPASEYNIPTALVVMSDNTDHYVVDSSDVTIKYKLIPETQSDVDCSSSDSDSSDVSNDNPNSSDSNDSGSASSSSDTVFDSTKGKAFSGTDEDNHSFGLSIACDGIQLIATYPDPNNATEIASYTYTYNRTSMIYEKPASETDIPAALTIISESTDLYLISSDNDALKYKLTQQTQNDAECSDSESNNETD